MASSNPANPLSDIGYFRRCVLAELKEPSVYFLSIIIGCGINLLSGSLHLAPFYVPLFVQVLSKASVHFNSRFDNQLLELPLQRKDPAFVMDSGGDIIILPEKFRDIFDSSSITSIKDLVDPRTAGLILGKFPAGSDEPADISMEAYSETLGKWYLVHARRSPGENSIRSGAILVWLQDVTPLKHFDQSMASLLNFTGGIVSELESIVKRNDIYDRLADFVIHSGWGGAMITRKEKEGGLSGRVFKLNEDNKISSKRITFDKNSSAPVFLSRKTDKVVSDDVSNYDSRDTFESRYPFDPRVKSFIGEDIDNFINYHQDDISIIVFNKEGGSSFYERRFMETLVDMSRTIVYLVDLAIENDEQFLQKVMGLCAAAEYSDEITGKHIVRVNEYSRFVAEQMGMDDKFTDSIGKVAALHDIGKVAISELIKLARKYTDEERARMQMHTVYGAHIIGEMIKFASKEDYRLTMARNIALHHHQTYNGKGYPGLKKNGNQVSPTSKNMEFYVDLEPLSGDEIPVEGLMVGLADRYDALRSARQYKPEFSHEKTMDIMLKDDRTSVTGEQWYGPALWRNFMENHETFDRIFEKLKD